MRLRRDVFGASLSEGQRLLWKWIVERKCEQLDLARHLAAPPSIVHRWLYGEGRPGLKYLPRLTKLGISISTWHIRPRGRFPLPELERMHRAALPEAA